MLDRERRRREGDGEEEEEKLEKRREEKRGLFSSFFSFSVLAIGFTFASKCNFVQTTYTRLTLDLTNVKY